MSPRLSIRTLCEAFAFLFLLSGARLCRRLFFTLCFSRGKYPWSLSEYFKPKRFMGCKTSRLSGSWEAVHPPHHGHSCHCVHDHSSSKPFEHPALRSQYTTRPDSPSVYSAHTRTTPAHSRSNSNDLVDTSACSVGHPMAPEQRPLLGSTHHQPRFANSSNSAAISKGVYSRFTPSSLPSTKLFSRPKANQGTPHFVFQREKPLPSHPGFEASAQEEVRRKRTRRLSHSKAANIAYCAHERQKDAPCFACLREKPKPRRHRSRRNAQVMIPRSSFMGRKRRRGSRGSSSSVEAPIPEEELPSWVTDRHSIFVPSAPSAHSVAKPRPLNYTYGEGNQARQKKPKGDSSKGLSKSGSSKKENTIDPYAAGGYIVSPEAYYATLPLPDLPTTHQGGQGMFAVTERKQRRNPVWI